MGNFDSVIDYINECALSDINGDCKLIEKIYTNQEDKMSFTQDRKHTHITYYGEDINSITEHKELFGRKLANNLQNSYLKGINHLIRRNLDQHKDPNQFLDDYDLMTWNHHIYNLSDLT